VWYVKAGSVNAFADLACLHKSDGEALRTTFAITNGKANACSNLVSNSQAHQTTDNSSFR
jgi:hypothetical protein